MEPEKFLLNEKYIVFRIVMAQNAPFTFSVFKKPLYTFEDELITPRSPFTS